MQEHEPKTPSERAVKRAKKITLKSVVSLVSKTNKGVLLGIVVLSLLVGAGVFVSLTKKSWFVAASVNGSPVSRLSVVRELEKQGGAGVLENMITKQLIAEEVRAQKIVVEKSDIDEELKRTEERVVAQGETLDVVLEQQGMTREDLEEQMLLKKQLESLLGDSVAVSEEEIDAYLKENKLAPTANMNADDLRGQVREQLESTKLSTQAGELITRLREKADIVHYVEY
jgi:hypothetical protein